MLSNILDIYLENVLLVLDVLDLLESDDVVDGEDLEGEVVAAVPLPAQTHAGERACKQKLYNSVDFLYKLNLLYILQICRYQHVSG